jgi:hypothetical protein
MARRERSIGLSADDPAALWLRLTPPEREIFVREVRSVEALTAWLDRRRQARPAIRR